MSLTNMTGHQGGTWMGFPHGHPIAPPPQPVHQDSGDAGMQTRPMGLKVQYTFEKDQQNCLARWPGTVQIQTISIDGRNSIGIVDLRICLQAIAQGSPEIVNQHDKDYAVYALDYSEEDIPLVGQGMLSWGLEQPTLNSKQKLITGRVVRNMMAVFRNGAPETLEVKLKLNPVPKMQRPQTSHNNEMQRGYGSNAPTPTPTDPNNEWSSFVQSNPNIGRPNNCPSAPSPNFAPARYASPFQAHSPAPDTRLDNYGPPPSAPTPPPSGMMAPQSTTVPTFPPAPSSQGPALEEAPRPEESARPKTAKRSSSKAPKKKRANTTSGKTRGRPPKNGRSDSGNTSALEDATDADEAANEGPKKKRAKTTKVDWSSKAPLDAAPGSLRVAASTSGSLRTMRPAASGNGGLGGSHLQEVPRAPTPVPGQGPSNPCGKALAQAQPRRLSMLEPEVSRGFQRFQVMEMGISAPTDARSPSESIGQSPFQVYTPEESLADIGSSPPVPRSTHSMRSSPPQSSPVLPPMPVQQLDSGFMSGGLDEIVDDLDLQLPASTFTRPLVPNATSMPQPAVSSRPKTAKAKIAKTGAKAKKSGPLLSRANSRPVSLGTTAPPPPLLPKPTTVGVSEPVPELLPSEASEHVTASQEQASSGPSGTKEIVFEPCCPGPQELLPKTSLYDPPGAANGTKAPVSTKAATRQLKGANAEPNFQRQELPDEAAKLPQTHQPTVEANQAEPDLQQSIPDVIPTVEPFSESFNLNESTAESSVEHMVKVSTETVNEQQVAAAAEPKHTEDPEEHLLRLLSEPMPMEKTQHGEPELPPMSSQGLHTSLPPDSDAPDRGCMLLGPASDPGVVGSADMTENLFSEDLQLTKNMSRKQSIKEKLEKAVESGQMPTFCTNCGSISTPTWRKIWTQECNGSPEFPVFSDKPGFITAIVILQRDEKQKPTRYQVVKKALAPAEDKSAWTETILCNPCGIWLSKYQAHRPENRWEKDYTQIGKSRRKKTGGGSRSRKSKLQNNAAMNLTSEAYLTTDPTGPEDQGPSPATDADEVLLLRGTTTEPPSRERGVRSQISGPGDSFHNPEGQGSIHSRRSGTSKSPIANEDNMGNTRRLLFPSPKKDGQPKVLGEVSVNIVRTTSGIEGAKKPAKADDSLLMGMDMEMEMDLLATPRLEDDEMADLFGTPPRPTTPHPKDSNSGVFKTPTRPTPSHRPITRSVSKSIRSVRTIAKSPGHALLQAQQTPTKTPKSSCRRQNGNDPHLHAHYALDDNILGGMTTEFGSPFSSTLNQLLSEAHDFTAGSPSHGLSDMDLLPNMHSDTSLSGQLDKLDFGNFLTTDAVMPSSPPVFSRSFGTASMGPEGWDTFGDVSVEGTHDREAGESQTK